MTWAEKLKFSLFLGAESPDSAGAQGAEFLLPDGEGKRDQDVSGSSLTGKTERAREKRKDTR